MTDRRGAILSSSRTTRASGAILARHLRGQGYVVDEAASAEAATAALAGGPAARRSSCST